MIVFASRTNNIRRIVDKLRLLGSWNFQEIKTGNEIVEKEFVLLTYTDLIGEVPEIVEKFLEKNHSKMIGVAGSGNRNFGTNFCKSAKIISKKYNVELIVKFELSGNSKNIEEFKNWIKKKDFNSHSDLKN